MMAAEIGRNVADKSLHPMFVAGSVDPIGDIFDTSWKSVSY